MGLPLEDLRGTPEETEQHIIKELQSSAKEKRALILKTSHIGGHKYAGNCIVCVNQPIIAWAELMNECFGRMQIYTPQGSSVWYGRVSPHEVESIVLNTIINGLVLPPLLRGGLNISRPGCKTLNDW
jgi:(2Fe-2S) ferredoxin